MAISSTITQIKKRNSDVVPFEPAKIEAAMLKAFNGTDRKSVV